MSSISRTGATSPAARTSELGARGRKASDGAPVEAAPASPGATPFVFEDDVARRVAAIGAEASDRRQRVVRAFLESCVARTFGAAAAQDPAFQHVVDQARQAIAADPALAAAMARVVDRLAGES